MNTIDDKIKYILLDYGDVLARPVSGNWFITDNFFEYVEKANFDKDKFSDAVRNYNDILGRKMMNKNDEYLAFYELFDNVLNNEDIWVNSTYARKFDNSEIDAITRDYVYNLDKHEFYDDVKKSLDILSSKYIVLLVSDNWPCAYDILNDNQLENYFDKMYISSEYECKKNNRNFLLEYDKDEKKDKSLFDYVIKDFDIKDGEALMIDDNFSVIKCAEEKGMKTFLMDRRNILKDDKKINDEFNVIYSLKEIIE